MVLNYKQVNVNKGGGCEEKKTRKGSLNSLVTGDRVSAQIFNGA